MTFHNDSPPSLAAWCAFYACRAAQDALEADLARARDVIASQSDRLDAAARRQVELEAKCDALAAERNALEAKLARAREVVAQYVVKGRFAYSRETWLARHILEILNDGE